MSKRIMNFVEIHSFR